MDPITPSALPQDATMEGALRLTDWGVIRAQGADAASFLHGQLTQDINQLGASQARLAGYCSAKGRLLASLVVCRRGPEELLLLCSADLLAPTLKRLSMFVLRAKCKLSDASAELAVHGLVGIAATRMLGDAAPGQAWAATALGEATALRLPDAMAQARYLLIQPASAAAPALPALDAATWAWLEVRSAVPRITAATVEQFVPQMVNMELVGGVNFQKGCYPGQEVVARSQYRGTLKRRGQLLDTDSLLQPGQEVFHSADPGQPAGMVVLGAPRPGGGGTALVELKLAAMEGGSLHAGNADGPLLHPLPLPYAMPTEAA
jgi:folate-binding protein YgfZ